MSSVDITKEQFDLAYKIAGKLTSNKDDQEDIVSWATLKLWKALTKKGFSPSKGYEYVVLYSGAIDYFRNNKKQNKIKPCSLTIDLEDIKANDLLEQVEIKAALENMKDSIEDYEVLAEFIEHQDYTILAKEINKTENASRVNVHRKRGNWKEAFKEIQRDSPSNPTPNLEQDLQS